MGYCYPSGLEKKLFVSGTYMSRWYAAGMLLCSIAHSIICTVRLFRGKMHSDWFNGVEILQGRWQHGEKVGYCYPSGLGKTVCKWDIHTCPAGHERVNFEILFYI